MGQASAGFSLRRTSEVLAKFEETACLNSTLKGIHLPSRDREGAVMLPNFASTSSVRLPQVSDRFAGRRAEARLKHAAD